VRRLVQKDLHEPTVDMELALGAVAAFPTLEGAVEYLRDAHEIQTTPERLEVECRRFPERLAKFREEWAPKREALAAEHMLNNTTRASEVLALAIEKTREHLESSRCTDPATVARNLADVMAKSVDKRLSLQGRPTQITEHRDVNEIVRALEGMKVVTTVQQPVIEGTTTSNSD
jgi:hypothetical protein